MNQNQNPNTENNVSPLKQKVIIAVVVLATFFIVRAQGEAIQMFIWMAIGAILVGVFFGQSNLPQDNTFGDLSGRGATSVKDWLKKSPALMGIILLVLSFLYSLWFQNASLFQGDSYARFESIGEALSLAGTMGYWLAVFRLWRYMSRW